MWHSERKLHLIHYHMSRRFNTCLLNLCLKYDFRGTDDRFIYVPI